MLQNRTKLAIALLMTIIAFISVVAISQDERQGSTFVKGESPGYYYVPEGRVTQNDQSAAISLITAGISGVPRYALGLQVIFETQIINGNNANITLDVDGLGVKKLLTQDGKEFGIGTLDAGTIVTATYNGTDFRADFNPRPQFRYIEPDVLMLTGNDYSITDTSIPPIATEPVLIGIKAEATNTGDVTLSINNSTDYPILMSNGDQIPAGALEDGEFVFCIFTATGGVGFRAINLRPPRALRGQLIATLEIPAGTYQSGGDAFSGWTLEQGVTEITVVDFPGGGFYGNMVSDAMIAFPSEQLSESQLGWFLEVDNGTIPVFTELKLFGYSSSAFALEIVGTDDPNAMFTMRWPAAGTFSGVDEIGLIVSPFSSFTLATPYTFNLYVTEN